LPLKIGARASSKLTYMAHEESLGNYLAKQELIDACWEGTFRATRQKGVLISRTTELQVYDGIGKDEDLED